MNSIKEIFSPKINITEPTPFKSFYADDSDTDTDFKLAYKVGSMWQFIRTQDIEILSDIWAENSKDESLYDELINGTIKNLQMYMKNQVNGLLLRKTLDYAKSKGWSGLFDGVSESLEFNYKTYWNYFRESFIRWKMWNGMPEEMFHKYGRYLLSPDKFQEFYLYTLKQLKRDHKNIKGLFYKKLVDDMKKNTGLLPLIIKKANECMNRAGITNSTIRKNIMDSFYEIIRDTCECLFYCNCRMDPIQFEWIKDGQFYERGYKSTRKGKKLAYIYTPPLMYRGEALAKGSGKLVD